MQRILIVDDMPDNLYFLEVLLKGNGFEVASALNGAEALQSARTNPPDLVVSDILMPVMDGYTLCSKWRGDEQLHHIPFVFYTATFTSQKDEVLALSLGADAFVVKPQEPDALVGVVRRVLAAPRDPAGVPAAAATLEEDGLLKEYSEALFRKLEKKMAALEKANRELEESVQEQKRLELQLRQAQKMEAVGRFSAGIAHDLNNILTVIIGFGSMMNMHMATGDPQRDRLSHILSAADRAKNLTSSLLTFSRKQEMKLRAVELNEVIGRVDTFLRRVIGEEVILSTSLKDEKIMLTANGGNLEQVVMNLAVNARDAMPDGGTLAISTDTTTIDENFVRMHGYGKPGKYALLSVSDTGIGMDEATRQQVFEPFFTTKEEGKGTGLGLSIVFGIVQQHNGFITLYSEPGQGTTFKILLPLMTDEAAAQDVVDDSGELSGGTETILVVDDEASIREYLEMFLQALGYRVLCATDGQAAVELYRARGGDIDLVLMDVIMPHKSARDTAGEIRAINSNVKILFNSGYPNDLIYERRLLDEGETLIMKPIIPRELATSVRELLD